MAVSLKPYGSDSPGSEFLAWTPVPLTVSVSSNEPGGTLRLASRAKPGAVTSVVFLDERDSPPQDFIDLPLGPGETREIFIAGEFQPGQPHFGASAEGKDVIVEASWVGGGGMVAGSVELMVRVRRNANDLSTTARDDFLFALGKLNGIPVDMLPTPGPGRGIYVSDFVAMHVDGASASEHGDSHFVPWHRLYLLDLERQLQAIVPEVTLPYWRFDEPAPNLFTEDFMGEMDQIPRDITAPGGGFDQGGLNTPLARFAVNNPLSQWQINSSQGIPRTARFDPMTEAANGLLQPGAGGDFGVLSQPATLNLGGGSTNPSNAHLGSPSTTGFARMESTPHGAAHVSFNGPINFVPVAPRDPLFFLLHCNVDRLWAVWQAVFDRDDFADTQSYPYQNAGDASPWEIVGASQWPWDGSNSQPGSLPSPGTRQNNFTAADVDIGFPGASPALKDAIDPYDNRVQNTYMGFGYDDVPYNHALPLTN